MSFEIKEHYEGVPVVDVDPFSPETLRSPEAFWADLRDVGPVAYIPRYGNYILSRYEEVRQAQADWRALTTAAGAGMSDIRKADHWRPASVIVEVDPPRHTEVRKVLNKVIAPPIVRGWRERFEEDAQQMADQLVAKGRFDGVRDVAEAYVLKVFPESIGLDINREQAVAVGDLNFNGIGPKNELLLQAQEKVAPFLEWWHSSIKGETIKPGGFGELLFNGEATGEVPKGMAGALTSTFLRGGLDTTISSIGSALWLLASHPDQWQLLKERPELLRNTFDETLRMESPISTNFRTTASGPCQISGFTLQGDKKVQLLLGAANRDPRRWDKPDTFDITRDASAHVSFGNGIHACAGQLIARLEFDCIIKALLQRVAKLELDGPVRHRPNNALRTLETLPLRITLHA